MPATYEPIATTTLGSAAASITFSGIPATYTDLRLVLVGKTDSSGNREIGIRFNSDSATNYSVTTIIGNGSAASSTRLTSQAQIFAGEIFSSQPTMSEIDIFSYGGSTNKTVLIKSSESRNSAGSVRGIVGLYRSVTAITSITLVTNADNYDTNYTATLYGILKA